MNIIERMPNITKEAFSERGPWVIAPKKTDTIMKKLRPDKTHTLECLNGDVLSFSLRSVQSTEVQVNGRNRYFFWMDDKRIEISKEEFADLIYEVQGEKFFKKLL